LNGVPFKIKNVRTGRRQEIAKSPEIQIFNIFDHNGTGPEKVK